MIKLRFFELLSKLIPLPPSPEATAMTNFIFISPVCFYSFTTSVVNLIFTYHTMFCNFFHPTIGFQDLSILNQGHPVHSFLRTVIFCNKNMYSTFISYSVEHHADVADVLLLHSATVNTWERFPGTPRPRILESPGLCIFHFAKNFPVSREY